MRRTTSPVAVRTVRSSGPGTTMSIHAVPDGSDGQTEKPTPQTGAKWASIEVSWKAILDARRSIRNGVRFRDRHRFRQVLESLHAAQLAEAELKHYR